MAWVVSVSQPFLVIIGGPNGSGKSTFYKDGRFIAGMDPFWIVNPDLLAAKIASVEPAMAVNANLHSVNRIEHWLEACLYTYSSVGVETVLSTEKYKKIVLLAKSLGFKFVFWYVVLHSPDLNIKRVATRVRKHGHAVPPDKIVSRFRSSLAQMPWFLHEANSAVLWDNSGDEPVLVGAKSDGILSLCYHAPTVLHQALQSYPGQINSVPFIE